MHPDIPHLSQRLDVRSKFWRPRTCGIVALKMVLDYWYHVGKTKRTPSIPALARLGRARGAYVRDIGWSHRGLALLAQGTGLDGKNLDWFALSPAVALTKLAPLVRRGPVIASVYRNPKRKRGGHLVVVTDIGGGRIHILDPAAKTRGCIPRVLSRRAFLGAWKRRIVVVRPRLRKRRKLVH